MMCHGKISWQNVIKWAKAVLNKLKYPIKKALFHYIRMEIPLDFKKFFRSGIAISLK